MATKAELEAQLAKAAQFDNETQALQTVVNAIRPLVERYAYNDASRERFRAQAGRVLRQAGERFEIYL